MHGPGVRSTLKAGCYPNMLFLLLFPQPLPPWPHRLPHHSLVSPGPSRYPATNVSWYSRADQAPDPQVGKPGRARVRGPVVGRTRLAARQGRHCHCGGVHPSVRDGGPRVG